MQLNAFDIDELVALARMDVESSRLDAALEKLKEADMRKDRPPELDILLARLYAQIGLLPRAAQYFSRYLEAHPEAELERFQLGMVHFDSNDYAAAIAVWDGVLKRHPTHPPALFYRALANANRNQADEAMRDLDVLLKSAAVDNLYFGRAKELLSRIAANEKPLRKSKESKEITRNDSIYNTEF